MGLCPPGLRSGDGSSTSSARGMPGNRAVDALLLGDDHLRGVLADRQPPCPAAGLGVVVDQDRGTAGVEGQAVQRQAGDVLRAAAGVDRDLHGGTDLGRLELVQAGAQRGHDLRGQVTSRLATLGQGRDVGSGEDDVAGQAGGGLARPGQPQGADPGQDRACARTGLVALVAADRALRFQVAQTVQEVLGVPAAQRGGHSAVVGPGTQAFGQPGGGVDHGADVRVALAPAAGKVLRCPPLGRLPQPWLGDAGEIQPPPVTEHCQIPDVAGLLGSRISQRPPHVPGERAQQRPGRFAGHLADLAVLDRGDLLAGQHAAGHPQADIAGLHAVLSPPPHPEQHLHHHQRRQAVQAHVPALGDRRLGQLPAAGVQTRACRRSGPPPRIVRPAPAAATVSQMSACRHRARRRRPQRPDQRISQEILHRQPACPAAELPGVLHAQRSPVRGRPHAPGHQARPMAGRIGRQMLRRSNLRGQHACCRQAGEAAAAHPAASMRSASAPADPAHLPAQQLVAGRRGQHPGDRIPPRPGQERRLQQHGQPAGRAVQDNPGQHIGELLPGDGRQRPRPRCCAHGRSPAGTRGLGTASTAARSRPGSG